MLRRIVYVSEGRRGDDWMLMVAATRRDQARRVQELSRRLKAYYPQK
jgi:hypothetical protein